MTKRPWVALFLLVSSWACEDPVDPDGGPPADRDGGTVVRDGGVSSDAGDDRDAGEGDAGTTDAGSRDAGSADATMGRCDDPFTLDGVVLGTLPAMRTLLPGSATPATVTRIEEAETFVAGAMSRIAAPNGHLWSAQISHLTMFDMINYEHVIRDPSDGAIYAVVAQQMQRDGTAIRFYDSGGTLAVELVRDGTPGMDVVGANRQHNFLLVKYDAAGEVQWVSRFGPNGPGTDRAGSVHALGLTPTGVRVIARVEGATQIVFAPGTPSELLHEAPGPNVFWGEISKADGSYVNGSFRSVSVTGDGSPGLTALGAGAHAPDGTSAFGGVLFRESGSATFTVGEGGAGALTVTTTTSLGAFGRIGPDGAPDWVVTAGLVGDITGPVPRAVGISPSGEVVGGAQVISNSTTVRLDGTNGSATLAVENENSFLVALSPAGAVRWTALVPSQNRNAISRIMVTDDAVYVLGTHAAGEVLGPGTPNEVTLAVNGTTLSKYALATGAFEWARALTSVDGNSSALALDAWPLADGRTVVPAVFVRLRVVGGGEDRIFDAVGAGMTGGVIFGAAGEILECQPLSDVGRSFRSF